MSIEKIVFTFLLLIHGTVLLNAFSEDSQGCQNFDLVTVRNSSTGIEVLVTTVSDLKGRNLDLQGYYLPDECDHDFSRCNLAMFRYEHHLYILIPSIRGMVAITYNYVNSTNPQFSHQFVPATRSCNIVKMFYTGPNDGYRVIGACMDVPANSDEGSMYILEYRFRVDENGTGFFAERKTSISETIYNPGTVSEVVYASGQGQCSYEDNVYFIDDGYVIQFPVDRATIGGQFEQSLNYFKRCSTFKQIEHFGGSNIVVYCPNDTAVVHDTCAGSSEYYSSSSGRGIPYPCSNWNTVVYLKNNNTLSFNNQEIPLPNNVGPVLYGRCVDGTDSPTFVVMTLNGIFSILLNEGINASINIISNGCDSTDSCFRPMFSLEDENIFGTFDARNGSDEFVVANFSKSCSMDPISFRLHIPIQPHLSAISLRSDAYNCTCKPKDVFIKNLRPAGEIETHDKTTPGPDTNTNVTTIAMSNVTDRVDVGPPAEEARSAMGLVYTIVPIIVGILVVVSVIFLIAIAIGYRCRKKQSMKYTGIHQTTSLQTDKKKATVLSSTTSTAAAISLGTHSDTSETGHEGDVELQHPCTLTPISESICRYGGVDVAHGSSLPHPSSNFVRGRAESSTVVINTDSQYNNNNNNVFAN